MPSKFLSSFSSVGKEERERSSLKNGSKLLEDLIASCDGKYNPIRCYSADELIRATNNFDPSCAIQYYGDDRMYKGFADGQSIIINKFEFEKEDTARSEAIRDIVVSIQMSKHKNVLKLLGYCLEFPVPALVLEYATKGPLTRRGGLRDTDSLPWKTRLRIAKQLSNAVTYLHTALATPIIHRDIKCRNIVLDNDYVPKLCDFSLSITLPPKQLQVKDSVKGTAWYLDPAYYITEFISEKSDVYSFGVLLLVLLTGRSAFDHTDPSANMPSVVVFVRCHACDEQIERIVDPKIFEEVGGDGQAEQQLREFIALALLCTKDEREERPYMIDVAKELVRIEKSILPC